MRHLSKGRKFGRIKGRRKSFVTGLVQNFIMEERIKTTEARAKEIKPKAEKLITIAKQNDLSALRLLVSRLPKKAALKLYYEIAPRYKDRRGGYSRIIKTSAFRKRDAAPQVILELIK